MTDTRTALAELAAAEAHYRLIFQTAPSADHLDVGRAWDRMRKAGDAARKALAHDSSASTAALSDAGKQMGAQPEPALSPSEAVYAFAGWLTCRDEAVTMGSTHNAAIAAELVDAFCESQHLEPPRQEWNKNIKHYPLPAAPPPPAAQPEGDVVVTKNQAGQIVAVTRQDSEGRILSVIAESAAQPALSGTEIIRLMPQFPPSGDDMIKFARAIERALRGQP